MQNNINSNYNGNNDNNDNIINLKCIDDFNNKIGLILQKNINGMLKLLNINYIVDIPKSELFSSSNNNNDNNNDNDNDIYKENRYSKSMLFDPFE